MPRDMFDYVVVGAGSAGCVLANRLTADGKSKVALIEAGPRKHHSFKVRAVGMYFQLWRTPLDWAFQTEPQRHVDNRKMFWPRGKVIGGTGSFNSVVYIRGHRANYDEWRDLGNPGWGWSDVLPYFKRSQDCGRGASEYHGTGGPLAVDDIEGVKVPALDAWVKAAAARCKVPINDDFNGAEQEGVGYYQFNLRKGLRQSTAIAFLEPALARKNLTVITDALATSLVVNGDRVSGVRIRVKGSEQTIEGREVIVCGGAVGSPHLLMLSGIGAEHELREAKVQQKHDLPGVGKHLEDHLLAITQYRATGVNALTHLRKLTWVLRYLLGKSGPVAQSPPQAGGFIKNHPDAKLPDNQFHVVPFGLAPPNSDEPSEPPLGGAMMNMPGLIYPKSHGTIWLKSGDPAAAPAIDPNYFSDPADLEHLVDGVILAREIAATAPLTQYLGDEIWPGPKVITRDDIRASVRTSVNTIFHPTGTCRMGTGARAVVDPELRVHGMRGLRVADASVMPRIIGGNTNAPTIMIAEKAADLLLQAR